MMSLAGGRTGMNASHRYNLAKKVANVNRPLQNGTVSLIYALRSDASREGSHKTLRDLK